MMKRCDKPHLMIRTIIQASNFEFGLYQIFNTAVLELYHVTKCDNFMPKSCIYCKLDHI